MATIEIRSEVAGTVFVSDLAPGARVAAGDPIVILESMKMEIPVDAPSAGTVLEILAREGDPVDEEQVLAILQAD